MTCAGVLQPDPVTGAAPKYDSTDAYAGTFLTLVAEYAGPIRRAADVPADPGRAGRADAVADAIGATRGRRG